MSIEKILTDLTAALVAQTAAMEKMIAGAGGKPAAAKPAAAKAKATGPSVEDAATAVTAYLKGGDASARAEAKANVGKIIEHFGADRFTTIPEELRQELLDMLAQFVAGETPDAFADGEEAGEDEDNMV